MSHTYLSADNSRGGDVTAANPSFAHIRGWDVGVRVEASERGTHFDVYLTGGSNGHKPSRYVGAATLGSDGPVFTPAEPAGGHPSVRLWERIQALSEQNGGDWPGADVVDILTRWFQEEGFDIE